MNVNRALTIAVPTRRQMIAGLALAIGSFAKGSDTFASPTPPMPEQRGVLGKSPCSIHQETRFDASPHRIYGALLDSKQSRRFLVFRQRSAVM